MNATRPASKTTFPTLMLPPCDRNDARRSQHTPSDHAAICGRRTRRFMFDDDLIEIKKYTIAGIDGFEYRLFNRKERFVTEGDPSEFLQLVRSRDQLPNALWKPLGGFNVDSETIYVGSRSDGGSGKIRIVGDRAYDARGPEGIAPRRTRNLCHVDADKPAQRTSELSTRTTRAPYGRYRTIQALRFEFRQSPFVPRANCAHGAYATCWQESLEEPS